MDEAGNDQALKNAAAALSASALPGLSEFVPKPLPAPFGSPTESIFGARVQAARNHFGLSVDALSRVTKATDTHEGRGISATALLRYEAGEALPGARELRLLTEALGVSADWLLTGEAVPGISIAEQELLAALWGLHQHHALRNATGDAVAMAPAFIQKQTRLQRIADAKRRT